MQPLLKMPQKIDNTQYYCMSFCSDKSSFQSDQALWLIILMSESYRQVIKRAVSNRQNSLRQHFLPYASLRRSSLQMSIEMSPKRWKPLLHGGRGDKKKREGSIISKHPFSFVSHKQEQPQQFKSNEKAHAFVYQNYDIMDLSYTLISSQISKFTLIVIYIILLIIRYGSLLCLIYITIKTDTKYWEWVFCIVITYLLYFILVIKVSLRPAQNKCETVLKLVFDSIQSHEAVEYFQIIDMKKLIQTIFRALIPPQYAFLYIVASSQMKRFQIYCMINYIYSSIEAIIYYPFFVIYTSIYFDSTLGEIPEGAYLTVMGAITLAESIFLILTIYLVWYGCKKRGYSNAKR